MLASLSQMPVDIVLRYALLPLVLLQLMVVPFYIIWTMRQWPTMPRREALLYTPLALPVSFLGFFLLVQLAVGGVPLGRYAGVLGLLFMLIWLPGIPVAAVTYRRVKRRL